MINGNGTMSINNKATKPRTINLRTGYSLAELLIHYYIIKIHQENKK